MISAVAATLLTLFGLIGVVLWKAWPLLPRWTATALRNLPGPPSPSWFYGNFQEINAEERSVVQERWIAKYGPNIVYKNFLNVRSTLKACRGGDVLTLTHGHAQNDRLYTIDTRALNHILTHSVDYQKPIVARRNLAKVLGEGEAAAVTTFSYRTPN